MQTQFRLGSYIHACTNVIHSLANLQDLIPTLAAIIIVVGIKSCRFAREYVFPLCMHGYNYPAELCLHEQTQIFANVACRVGGQQFLS